eukprot:TRINITY_DN483_c0_g1_i3.p1 TRINITY_DN483_c0_g1~~TRINITY_DN483_c0_g1_i3.p1  ORF type:complete len:347 (+),score=65.64 TRINITY_DN483_c0_g1_i3:162-1202(+)
MGQFGLHAIVSLLLTTFVVPKSYPTPARWWLGAGLYLGCVFPDLDVFPEAVVMLFGDPKLATQQIHRTFLHSFTLTFLIFFFLLLLQSLSSLLSFHSNSSSPESEGLASLHSRYSSISEPSPLYYSLNVSVLPTSTNIPGRPVFSRRQILPNLHRFGLGLLLGCLSHILIDIVIWFSFVDVLWPLSLFPSLNVGRVDIWQNTKIPELVMDILTVAELWCVAIFFTLLRVVCTYQMKFLIGIRDNLEAKCGQESEEMGREKGEEGIGEGKGTLKGKVEDLVLDKRRLLRVLMCVEILHYVYGIAIGVMLEWMIDGSLAFKMVYDVLLCLSMPLFYFFSFRLKDLILW